MALDHHTVMDRLANAKGPHRDLDADVYEALGYQVKRYPVRDGRRHSRSWSYLDGSRWLAMSRLTSSLDDAMHLIDKILPGCGVSVDRNSTTTATIWRRDKDGHYVAGEIEYQVEAASMPLAVTLAALRSHFSALATIDTCPICAKPLNDDDICATDIEMGPCHAACLEGSPTVDLETGAEIDGPMDTYRWGDTAPTNPKGISDE